MIDLKEFLLKNIEGQGEYALVSYNGVIEATWFTKYKDGIDNKPWFLESPCELHKICKVEKPIVTFCKEYLEECIEIEDGESEEDYIENFIKPMIVDGWFYEINNYQTAPYLPKEVETIEIITERKCLEWLIKNTN